MRILFLLLGIQEGQMIKVNPKKFGRYIQYDGKRIRTTRGDITDIIDLVIPGYKCHKLTSLALPDTATTINPNAFRWCTGLVSLTLPDTITAVGDGAFYVCTELTSLTLPTMLTSVGDNAFASCRALTSITFPKSLVTLGNEAFCGCESLASISFPHTCTSFGLRAFANCRALTTVIFRPRLTGASPAFIAWAISNSHNRKNCKLTTVKYLHNVLRLVTTLALERRNVSSVDPNRDKHVFSGCMDLKF